MPSLMTLNTSPITGERIVNTSVDKNEWVLAAPFRAHVIHLMETARVPWPVIGYQAGVPLGTLRTLLFGRNGKLRTKIAQPSALRLIELRTEDLSWMRASSVSAETAGARIRMLRSRHISWENISCFLGLDEQTCQEIAHGERCSCTVLVDILAQSACELAGFNPWEDIDNWDDCDQTDSSQPSGLVRKGALVRKGGRK